VAAHTVSHTQGKPAAANAQAASKPDPEREVAGQAAGNRVSSMETATEEPVPFDATTFKVDVRAAVEKIAPPATLDEADRFEESGKAGQATAIARGLVKGGQVATEQPIATSTAAPPDKTGLKPKPVGDMVNDPVDKAATTVAAATVLPPPKPDSAVHLSAGPHSVDEAMTAQGITVPQLTEANEPRFTAALDARQAVVDQAAAAVPTYRGEEAALLSAAAAALGSQETAALAGMHAARVGSLHDVRAAKNRTRDDDKKRRDDVGQALLDIHQETKGTVERILHELDAAVTKMFTEGEEDARYTFEHYVAFKMEEYKDERYGGLGGGALWLKDRFFDLPDEVNAFYEKGRFFYLTKLDRTIDAIAVVIGASLGLATLAIRLGRLRVQHLLTTLPAGLVQLGVETAQQLDQRFDLLASDVTSARDHLVDVVARTYVDANKKLDDRITELQEENEGLATRAIEFTKEVGHTIAELGRLLSRILLKAASVIGSILAHPIRFFGHLVDAIGDGFSLFVQRIGKHLEEALLDLLFGDLGKSGITLPTSLDYAGLFDLVCQVLQIRWVDLRARLVDKIGLAAVLHLERVADVFRLLADKGIGGLWELAMQRLSELPDLVIGALKTYVIEQVVKTGIEYIVSLLTPASAFIKACQGIYRLLSFIVDKARQIGDFIEAVLDSMAAIASGDTAAAAERIDAALAGALKLALGFLAKLAHLDTIAEKAHAVIETIRAPVRRVVDGIIDGAVSLYQSTIGSLGARRAERMPGAAVAKAPLTVPAHAAPPAVHPAAHPGAGPGQLVVAHPAPGQPPGQRPSTPAAAQHPADPDAGSDRIDDPVVWQGMTHHLVNDGPSGALVLHTVPTLVNTLPDPALQALVAQYNAIQLTPSNPAWNSRTKVKEARKAKALEIAAWITAHAPPGVGPGGSAPGLGNIERHGAQVSRLSQGGIPMWILESEHVIPFDVIRGLGEVLGTQGRATRGVLSSEDRALTTIAIYERAADFKTRREVSRRNRLADDFSAMAVRFANRLDYEDAEANRTMRAWVLRSLRREGTWYVDLTWQGVQFEHAMPEGSSTRGALRAEASPLPAQSAIQSAADQEFQDATAIVDAALPETVRP
jgi:hypothetical protein